MIPELQPIFEGPFAEVGKVLSISAHPETPLHPFLTSTDFQTNLALFSKRWPDPDARAVATQWSKTYFATLLPAVLLPLLMKGWRLPLHPEKMGIRLAPDGAVCGFDLPGIEPAQATPADPFTVYDFLIEDHLRPVIETIASASSLSQKVLWSNAGNVFENIISRAGRLLGPDHAAVRHAHTLMSARRRTDGRVNPLYEPIRYIEQDGEKLRMRRICCLRYFTESLGYCKSCPKPNER